MPSHVSTHVAHVCACGGILAASDFRFDQTIPRTVPQRAAKADRQLRHERHLRHSPVFSDAGLRHCPNRLRHLPLSCVIAAGEVASNCTELHRCRSGMTQVTLMTQVPEYSHMNPPVSNSYVTGPES